MDKRPDLKATVVLNSGLCREFATLKNISFVEVEEFPNSLRRFYHEQTAFARLIKDSGSQILISAGNFALWNSPVPQILLSRNSLYTSEDFARDVRSRGDY